MALKSIDTLDVFISYAHEDTKWLNKLVKHLSLLQREGLIRSRSDQEIDAGKEWAGEIRKYLETAHIILLLVSPDFMASDYCYSDEMVLALKRHDINDARVIPVILRPVDWEKAPFGKLQALPRHGQPITTSVNHDQTFADVAQSIRRVIECFYKEQYLKEGNIYRQAYKEKGIIHREKQSYEEALKAFEQARRLLPDDPRIHNEKGITLRQLKRDEEALAAFEQALNLDSNYTPAYKEKGLTLRLLGHYKDALIAFEKAIVIDSSDPWTYTEKGIALRELKFYEKALAAFEQALNLDRNYTQAYKEKGFTLRELGRYKDARATFEQALQLDPLDPWIKDQIS